MSLLQDILDKMYVEPELLEQLDEDQKQTLFIKMREEQMRRWRVYEEEMSKRERENPILPSQKRRIEWLKGRDGEIWVWVMGEHQDDSSIEEIIETETKRKAREIAEIEALADLRLDDTVTASDLDENNLKKELSKMTFSDGNNLRPLTNGTQASNLSLYDDAMHAVSVANEPIKPSVSTSQPISYFSSFGETPVAKSSSPPKLPINNHFVNGASTAPVPPKKPVPPPVPSRPAHLQKKPDNDFVHTIRSYTPGREPITVPVSQSVPITSTSSQNIQKPQTTTPLSTTTIAPLRPPMQEVISNKPVFTEDVKFRNNARNVSVSPTEIEKRQSEIFERMMEEHDRLQKEADAEEERRRRDFAEQARSDVLERRAREAETKIRVIAQRARDQYARSMRTSDSLLPALNDTSASSLKEAIKRIRPPKPGSRQAIVKWYTEVEMPKGTGFDPKTNTPARWFHGIISRDTTESILAQKPSGSFIVRVSEKIWGYTVSYVNADQIIKHFLVETIPEGYQFLGTNQFVHKSLYDLVLYHETAPITAKGKEILRSPIGQVDMSAPDYADLIDASSYAPYRPNAFRRF